VRELYGRKESKMAFEDHIYVLKDMLGERKLKVGDAGFNSNPSARKSASHTIAELVDKFDMLVREGGLANKMGKGEESVEEILQKKVEDAFEYYEERVSAVSKWGRGGDVQFSEMVGDSMYVMTLKLGESATCVEMAQAVAVAEGMTEKMLGLVREVNEDRRRILARAMAILKNLREHSNFARALVGVVGEDVFRESLDFLDEMEWSEKDVEIFQVKVDEEYGCYGDGMGVSLRRIQAHKYKAGELSVNEGSDQLPSVEEFAAREAVYGRMRGLWLVLDKNFKRREVEDWEAVEAELSGVCGDELNKREVAIASLNLFDPFLVKVRA